MAKTREEMKVVRVSERECYLYYPKTGLLGRQFLQHWYWRDFKLLYPAIAEGLQPGQTRKLIRTQLKDGFQLQHAK